MDNDRYRLMMDAIRRWEVAHRKLQKAADQLQSAAAGFYDGPSNSEKISQLWDAKAELNEAEMALAEFAGPTAKNPPTDAPELMRV